MEFPNFDTTRLIIRSVNSEDLLNVKKLFMDEDVQEVFPRLNEMELLSFPQNKLKEYEDETRIWWAIALKTTNQLIGFISLISYQYCFRECYSFVGNKINDPDFMQNFNLEGFEVSYAMLKEYRKQGLMSESLKEVLKFSYFNNLLPIYAKVNKKNTDSLNLLKNHGFGVNLKLVSKTGEISGVFIWPSKKAQD